MSHHLGYQRIMGNGVVTVWISPIRGSSQSLIHILIVKLPVNSRIPRSDGMGLIPAVQLQTLNKDPQDVALHQNAFTANDSISCCQNKRKTGDPAEREPTPPGSGVKVGTRDGNIHSETLLVGV